MAFSRTSVVRGPAVVTWAGDTFYSQDDIKVTVGHEIFPIINSAFGKTDERSKQRTATVEFTPVGVPNSVFWDFGTLKSGDPILSAVADNDVVINSQAGQQITIYNACISKLPDLILSAQKTCCGSMTFTGLGKGNPGGTIEDQDTTDNFVKWENAAFPSLTFDPADVITETYSALWTGKAAPWDDIRTKDGWTLSFDLNLQPVETDSHGIIDWTVGDVTSKATCVPMGINDDILDQSGTPILGMHVLRGASITAGADFVITGASNAIIATINNALLRVVPIQYGLTTERIAQLEFSGVRRVVDGEITDAFNVVVA